MSTISKIAERTILTRIQEQTEENGTIPDHQFGFRRKHSAPQQATRLVDKLQRNKTQKKSSGVLALDIKNAFPSVWHAGLTYKLVRAEIDPRICKLVGAFLSERSFVARVGKTLSSPRQMPAGLPQGSVLSPTLYNIFTHDVPIRHEVTTLTFADDTALVAESKQARAVQRKLRAAFDNLASYADRWHIQISAEKTQYLFVPPDRKKRRRPKNPMTLNGVEVSSSSTIKYLGVHIDDKLAFVHHTRLSRGKVIAASRSLFAMTAGNSLDLRNRHLLLKQVLWPTITYAASAWNTARKSEVIYLRRSFSRAAKSMLKLNIRFPTELLYDNLNLPLLEEFVGDARAKLIENMKRSNEANLQNIAVELEAPLANVN